jgi:hypothetical protein
MPRQPCQFVRFGDARQRCDDRGRQWPGAADVDIESVAGRCHLNVQRLADRLQHLGQRARGIERAIQRGIENRARVDSDDGVACRCREADTQSAVAATPGMQRDAAAAGTMGIDDRIDRAGDLRLCQRVDHDLALPGLIGIGLPVLDGAAAAAREVGAERIDAFGTGGVDLQQSPALRMTVVAFRLDDLMPPACRARTAARRR